MLCLMKTQALQFLRQGQVITLPAIATDRTLLQVLREDLHCTGTKEGCNEGDCGACTVVLGEAVNGQLHIRAVNSCIKLAHSVQGQAVWTVEDIASTPGAGVSSLSAKVGIEGTAIRLHPAQAALVACHGSQCGFCTPGFVMSLFALYHTHPGQPASRAQAQQALSGNLCRCTGYRPILDAAQLMHALPPIALDETALLSKLEQQRQETYRLEADLAYKLPKTLPQLLQMRAQLPQAQLVAGCTDVGLWVTKQHRQLDSVIDLCQVDELRRVEDYPHHIAIGAAVNLNDAFAALVAQWPQLAEFAHRFAGLPVRNSGTLGGNVANGSPIGDSMPLLIAQGASVVLMAWRKVADKAEGKAEGKYRIVHRELRLEDLYTGYRSNVMAPDEVLAWIKVPKPSTRAGAGSLRVYKISKRFEDDISAVCLALDIAVANGIVQQASIGVGGVAATPVRARKTEAALIGQPWTQAAVQQAAHALRDEFSPISDMRASADYRRTVLGNLLQRYWLECQGQHAADLRLLQPVKIAT
jgi:xanthine dehydrogenase small subunit